MPYDISEDKREWYRQVSARSRRRKTAAIKGHLAHNPNKLNVPSLRPADLMPQQKGHGARALSLFSGGGGLDLGFERAGYTHVASFDILDICQATLRRNRPEWEVQSGECGDVTLVDWDAYRGKVDLLHGGPPCQPFSIAGKQRGHKDDRDMWPAFIDAILTLKPEAFVAENVPGLLDVKFHRYINDVILSPLAPYYHIIKFKAVASDYGVPQIRKRVFFVGFRSSTAANNYKIPEPTHLPDHTLFSTGKSTMGAREALGLDDVGFDCFAPTLRSGFTGPRKSTSILNSKASQAVWEQLKIWPNGVQTSRERALRFPPENGHFRLSVQDCAVLQGFPEDWIFEGAAYQILGQIGNSVCPPMGYSVAKSVARALGV
ncbi:MAG: DNA (cytosine-5-)-methyltransferase [Caldilineaceae bacterium]|nr:DNA (cytosine-5-)-methyltransferase [Caldilineaceae bacterium]